MDKGQGGTRKKKETLKPRTLHALLSLCSSGPENIIIYSTLFLGNDFKYFKDLHVSSGKKMYIYIYIYIIIIYILIVEKYICQENAL